MTRDITPDLQRMKLFLTEPHSCSYLPGRTATTAFVDPELDLDYELYDHLSQIGFRRSGKYLYTPRCEGCRACISLRINADEFSASRQQRRCITRNSDLKIELVDHIDPQEHYLLYERYITNRHSDGDMYPPSRKQFDDFVGNSHQSTRFLEIRMNNTLMGTAVSDMLPNGLSAIYTYFEPEQHKRGLGTYAILMQVEMARQYELRYVYLGFWIRKCSKMNYKAKFSPLELYLNGRWVKVSKSR